MKIDIGCTMALNVNNENENLFVDFLRFKPRELDFLKKKNKVINFIQVPSLSEKNIYYGFLFEFNKKLFVFSEEELKAFDISNIYVEEQLEV